MSAITVRNLSQETHRALKARAAAHGRSTEAEVRAILDAAVAPVDRVELGSLLSSMRGRTGVDLDIGRGQDPREPVDLR